MLSRPARASWFFLCSVGRLHSMESITYLDHFFLYYQIFRNFISSFQAVIHLADYCAGWMTVSSNDDDESCD